MASLASTSDSYQSVQEQEFDNCYVFSRFSLWIYLLFNRNLRKNLVHTNDGAARGMIPGCRGRVIPGAMISSKLDDYICRRYGDEYVVFAKEFTVTFHSFVEPGDSVCFLLSEVKIRSGFLFGKVESFKNGRVLVQTYVIKLGVKPHA